jgi:hypothetical protein
VGGLRPGGMECLTTIHHLHGGEKNCREDFSGKKTQRRENVLIHFRCNGDYLGL